LLQREQLAEINRNFPWELHCRFQATSFTACAYWHQAKASLDTAQRTSEGYGLEIGYLMAAQVCANPTPRNPCLQSLLRPHSVAFLLALSRSISHTPSRARTLSLSLTHSLPVRLVVRSQSLMPSPLLSPSLPLPLPLCCAHCNTVVTSLHHHRVPCAG
jgi:hypothetical protein